MSDDTSKTGKGISFQLSESAHAKLKSLRTDIVPDERFKNPEIINGILENISVEQVRELLHDAIKSRIDTKERKARVMKLIEGKSLDELEAMFHAKEQSDT